MTISTSQANRLIQHHNGFTLIKFDGRTLSTRQKHHQQIILSFDKQRLNPKIFIVLNSLSRLAFCASVSWMWLRVFLLCEILCPNLFMVLNVLNVVGTH